MLILLNGEQRQLKPAQMLGELIAELNLTQQAIAVAVNRQIVPRTQWAQRVLCADDKVDVVRAIGGG